MNVSFGFTWFLHLFYVGLTTLRDSCVTVEANGMHGPQQPRGSPDKAHALRPSTCQSLTVNGLNVELERVRFGRALVVSGLNVLFERLPFVPILVQSLGDSGRAASHRGEPK